MLCYAYGRLCVCWAQAYTKLQFYVNGRIVMVVDELSSFIAAGAQRRVGRVDGLRRHGRLEARRTDFKVDVKVSGLPPGSRRAAR